MFLRFPISPKAAMFSTVAGLSLASGCAQLVCGEGTTEGDGVCSAEIVRCGPGTVASGGECVIENQKQCGDDTVLRGDDCVSAAKQYVHAPFEPGSILTVSQGYHGYYSHSGSSTYAVDFSADEGTTVVAARGGVVLATRSDSDHGCPDTSCADEANYVVIDHGDATFGNYFHLEYDGVDVEIGEVVAAGHPIGRSGNTGYSSGPHLHLQVEDVFNQSLPMRFEELMDESEGVPSVGLPWVSENTEGDSEDTTWSSCPADTFAHMGVGLDDGVPCSMVQTDTPYTISGQVYSGSGLVQVSRWAYGLYDWQYECFELDDDGNFSAEIEWDSNIHYDDAWLMIAAADEWCWSYQSWAVSVWNSLQ